MENKIKFNRSFVLYQNENQKHIIGFINVDVFDDHVAIDIYKYQEGKIGLSIIEKYSFGKINEEILKEDIDEWINKCIKEFFSDVYIKEN